MYVFRYGELFNHESSWIRAAVNLHLLSVFKVFQKFYLSLLTFWVFRILPPIIYRWFLKNVAFPDPAHYLLIARMMQFFFHHVEHNSLLMTHVLVILLTSSYTEEIESKWWWICLRSCLSPSIFYHNKF